jgi:hypothetical protein
LEDTTAAGLLRAILAGGDDWSTPWSAAAASAVLGLVWSAAARCSKALLAPAAGPTARETAHAAALEGELRELAAGAAGGGGGASAASAGKEGEGGASAMPDAGAAVADAKGKGGWAPATHPRALYMLRPLVQLLASEGRAKPVFEQRADNDRALIQQVAVARETRTEACRALGVVCRSGGGAGAAAVTRAGAVPPLCMLLHPNAAERAYEAQEAAFKLTSEQAAQAKAKAKAKEEGGEEEDGGKGKGGAKKKTIAASDSDSDSEFDSGLDEEAREARKAVKAAQALGDDESSEDEAAHHGDGVDEDAKPAGDEFLDGSVAGAAASTLRDVLWPESETEKSKAGAEKSKTVEQVRRRRNATALRLAAMCRCTRGLSSTLEHASAALWAMGRIAVLRPAVVKAKAEEALVSMCGRSDTTDRAMESAGGALRKLGHG